MVDATTAVTLGLSGLASLFMAWTIGAGSSGSTPFAPAVGAQAIPVLRASLLVGILGLAGAVLQGASVTEAVGRELVLDATLTPGVSSLALLLAAGLVAVGVFRGYPIATAFTVTGAVIGAGLALGGTPNWGKYAEIGGLWLLTPPVAGGIAYATARMLRSPAVAETTAVPALAGLVGLLVGNMRFELLGPPGSSGSMAGTLGAFLPGPVWIGAAAVTLCTGLVFAGVQRAWMNHDDERGQFRFLVALGALVAFSAGGSQVGLALGPLLPALEGYAFPLTGLLVGGGFGLLVGSWTGAPRMIKALAHDYSSLGPRRSISALIPAFLIAQITVTFGIPISFNEVVVSAIVGSGYAAGSQGVSADKWNRTVAAWIGSLVLAFVLAYAGARLLTMS